MVVRAQKVAKKMERCKELAIDFAAMPYLNNHNGLVRIIDFVNDPVISNADSPSVVLFEFFAIMRTGFGSQRFDGVFNSLNIFCGNAIEFFFGPRENED